MTINNSSNTSNKDDSTSSSTIACFLDLPSGSAVNVDGVSVSIQRDDFVGLSQLPAGFHFIAITAKSITTGFVLSQNETLIRRYDPRTEEVSSTLVVDDTTAENLLQQVPMLEQQQRVVPYHLLVTAQHQAKWNGLTNFISDDLLRQRGVCMLGQKVVPGCLDDATNMNNNQHEPDGLTLSYFPVPILDQRRSRWASRHVGTQRFLQTLSAQEKTSLFLEENPSQQAWERVFATIYQNNWSFVLGDVQLITGALEDLLSLLGQLEHPSRLLIPVLVHQLSNLDASDVLSTSLSGDDEEDEENSIATALNRMVQIWSQQASNEDESDLQRLSYLIQDRLCPRVQAVDDDDDDEEEEDDDVNENEDEHDSSDDDDDSEGPMVVEMDDYQAALQRNQEKNRGLSYSVQYTPEISEQYPILWAAKQEHEDLVMTCVRALEDANDVSLVRQAADYLQQVEAKSGLR